MNEYAYVLQGDGQSELVPVTDTVRMDFVGYERLFHHIPQDQMEVLVCLFLGMKPNEIVKALKYKNIVRYYNVSARLRMSFKRQKGRFLDYN